MPTAAEATESESAAVIAQREKWGTTRQMIRELAEDHPELRAKLGQC